MLKYHQLREGDIWLYRNLFNHWSCGILVKPYGSKLFYIFKDNFKFKPLEEFKITAIKRPIQLFQREEDRVQLRKGLIKIHETCVLKDNHTDLGIVTQQKVDVKTIYHILKLWGYPLERNENRNVDVIDLIYDPFLVSVDWKDE